MVEIFRGATESLEDKSSKTVLPLVEPLFEPPPAPLNKKGFPRIILGFLSLLQRTPFLEAGKRGGGPT